MSMHEGEISITADLVRRLIATQFPRASHQELREFHSTGTVNAVFRLGEKHLVRLPRMDRWGDDLEREVRWLPFLAGHLSVRIPRVAFVGSPTADFPAPWAVYEWLDGTPYADDAIVDELAAARYLAAFIRELRRVPPDGAPPAGRRPLQDLDAVTRESIVASAAVSDGEQLDISRLTAEWDQLVRTPAWSGPSVWIHTDLLRPNILAAQGQIAGIIDWGGAGIGDPAADVIAAWSVFGPDGRRDFREALDVDDATWDRARGYALHQAALIIPYYEESNPAFVQTAVRTIGEILSDSSS
ncbi:aminoglycoside phosphotransferase (APT) family kinase protein [Okibacterium sp. HSC-33S16]|uniref:aminoglycoside phosphotransferase family protein n=1 Tax=Okibacterium sp. HSC-33S16 TaxID=2910965 RepID=UPI00209D7526|nr:aminoglycoside phosphotransferase family protein [Okibacterium sp. HSC-33S16]MCP2030807.1 aminoglycoside phosphotransferase (APT) family kinase protein [Okibacterium sp. HSC-33S16]